MPTPPIIVFRAGNDNRLAVSLTRLGVPVLASPTLKIVAELRLSPVFRPSVVVEFETVGDTLAARLPDSMSPAMYYLGFRFEEEGQHKAFASAAQVDLKPTGWIGAITSVNGLSVVLNEPQTTLSVELDASPAASLVAAYVEQAKLLTSQIITFNGFTQYGAKLGFGGEALRLRLNNNRYHTATITLL